MDRALPNRIEELTPRQRECLRLALQHPSIKEIAAALSLSPETVKAHVGAAMGKLGVSSRLAAARLLAEHEGGPHPFRVSPSQGVDNRAPTVAYEGHVELPQRQSDAGAQHVVREARQPFEGVQELGSGHVLPLAEGRLIALSRSRRLLIILLVVLGTIAGFGLLILALLGASTIELHVYRP